MIIERRNDENAILDDEVSVSSILSDKFTRWVKFNQNLLRMMQINILVALGFLLWIGLVFILSPFRKLMSWIEDEKI